MNDNTIISSEQTIYTMIYRGREFRITVEGDDPECHRVAEAFARIRDNVATTKRKDGQK